MPKSTAKPLSQSLAEREEKAAKSKVIDGKATVVANEDLPSLAATITFHQDAIDTIGRKAMQAALPLKLKQGLACLKAQALLAIQPDQRQGIGGRPKKTESESDSVSGESSEFYGSFADWLNFQPLTKGSAYDYMRAVEGLGLTHKATDKQLATAFDKARKAALKDGAGDLTITKLKNLASRDDEQDDDEQEDPNSPEAKAGEARVFTADFIRRWDTSVKGGTLEHADKATLQGLSEFLSNTLSHVNKRLKSAK